MAAHDDLTREVDVDLGAMFQALWRAKGKLLLAAIIMTALVFLLLQVMSPRYRSEARILVRASDSVLSAPDAGANQANSFDDPGIASQVQLLQSRDIARRVIADPELNLMSNPEFETGLESSLVGNLLEMAGLSNSAGVSPEDRVLDSFYSKLKVFQADNARVLVIQFASKDKELAAAIPNKIAQEYIRLQEELKRGLAPEELALLEPELENQRALVLAAEGKVADFRSQYDLQQGSDDDSLATQELSELATELGRVRAQLSQAEANADAVGRALDGGSLASAPQVLASPLVQRLQERKMSLESDLAEQLTSLLPGHPRVQRIESQIDTLERQLGQEARKVQRSLDEEADVARARESDLVQRRNQLKAESGRVDKAQVELRSLEREADAQRQLLNQFLLRFKEAKSRQKSEFLPADAFVFSQAQVQSNPYFPKKIPILAGTFFGTLMLGALIVLASSILSGPDVRTVSRRPVREDARQVVAPPIAPSMNAVTAPVIAQPNDTSVPADIAAISIAELGRSRIAALSPGGPDGSAITVELARSIRALGVNTLLVDIGGGAATQAVLGRSDLPGLKNVLSGQATYADALHCEPGGALHILPMGTDGQGSSGTRLPGVVDALSRIYECVILDCGSSSAEGLSRIFDAETVCVLTSTDANDPRMTAMLADLQGAGYHPPLKVRMSEELPLAVV
ncbi:Wzz/FepE/Etk N-terminal domain-containing protein [Rhizobiaceae bacterium]|nr:Wzz/FepE/Etk N-terminal domain-containing protein [Rhizobiaceae bacterium]